LVIVTEGMILMPRKIVLAGGSGFLVGKIFKRSLGIRNDIENENEEERMGKNPTPIYSTRGVTKIPTQSARVGIFV
jgi:hypothetical protein